MVALDAASELLALRRENASDKRMIAELTQFAEGEAKLVEVTGEYAVERTVNKTTYEVK